MLNNVRYSRFTVSLTGGDEGLCGLYDDPPLHHSNIACGRTEVVKDSNE